MKASISKAHRGDQFVSPASIAKDLLSQVEDLRKKLLDDLNLSWRYVGMKAEQGSYSTTPKFDTLGEIAHVFQRVEIQLRKIREAGT